MIIQISLAAIAIALVTLVGFLILAILKFRKAISLIQADIHYLSIETAALIARFNELTTDITRKTQSLNFLFAPLTYFNKENSSSQDKTLSQLVEWVATSLILVKKSKEFIKKYVK